MEKRDIFSLKSREPAHSAAFKIRVLKRPVVQIAKLKDVRNDRTLPLQPLQPLSRFPTTPLAEEEEKIPQHSTKAVAEERERATAPAASKRKRKVRPTMPEERKSSASTLTSSSKDPLSSTLYSSRIFTPKWNLDPAGAQISSPGEDELRMSSSFYSSS